MSRLFAVVCAGIVRLCCVIPMGWTWAPFIGHGLTWIMLAAWGPEEVRETLKLSRCPPAMVPLKEGTLLVCLDNVIVVTTSSYEAQEWEQKTLGKIASACGAICKKETPKLLHKTE